jgi:hypothetical protein
MQHGLADENEVPYTATDSECRVTAGFNEINASSGAQVKSPGVGGTAVSGAFQFGMTGWTKLPENSYEPLLRALVEHGPVAVSVGARGWHTYDSGIFDDCDKDAVINHAVSLLGYGIDHSSDNDKYWLLLNSWGPDWGEKGSMRLLRRDTDETEYCGIDRQPEVGTGCEGGPSEVKVCGMCGILYDASLPLFAGNMSEPLRLTAVQDGISATR